MTMDLRNEKVCSMEELIPLMRGQLILGQKVLFSPRGVSMRPMLREGKDQVEIAPLFKDLQNDDIILYQNAKGFYVLHRIIRMEGAQIYCLGDHLYAPDPPIIKEAVVGVVSGFYRSGRYISVENRWYRLYCRLWTFSYPFRRFLWRGIGWIKRRLNK